MIVRLGSTLTPVKMIRLACPTGAVATVQMGKTMWRLAPPAEAASAVVLTALGLNGLTVHRDAHRRQLRVAVPAVRRHVQQVVSGVPARMKAFAHRVRRVNAVNAAPKDATTTANGAAVKTKEYARQVPPTPVEPVALERAPTAAPGVGAVTKVCVRQVR